MFRQSNAAWALVGVLFASQAHANLIINGDFEDNTAVGSQFNLTNAEFNAIVANVTAFGTSEEIDLSGTDHGIAPQSGMWKIGLHQRTEAGFVDAFSFELSASIVSGNEYSLQFFAAGIESDPIGPVEIGLSSSATEFGVLVFSGTPLSSTEWTQFDHAFSAPIDASYLTVRNATLADMYALVDNFSLVPEPSTLTLLIIPWLALGRRRRPK